MTDISVALAGKVVVITGAGRGIGRAIALAYASPSAAVVCSARSTQEIDETVAMIKAAGGSGSACMADVGDYAAMKALFQHAADSFGAVDIVVGNAGAPGQTKKIADSNPAV